ncbi:hypothetical protein D3C87_2112480 [compost metagenome]
MRHAAGELADRFHLLGLAQVLLSSFSLAYLFHDSSICFFQFTRSLRDALFQNLIQLPLMLFRFQT